LWRGAKSAKRNSCSRRTAGAAPSRSRSSRWTRCGRRPASRSARTDLRRTYITAAESADISPLALRALVNHSLGGDVTSGYIVMTPERLREPAQRVCERLKVLCGIYGKNEGVAKLS